MNTDAITSAQTPAVPTAGDSPERACLDELANQVLACSREDKKTLLYRLLRDLLGENPTDEYGIHNPDGSSYIFLVPPRLHALYHVTPEELAQWQRDLESGEMIPFRETVARLKAMSQ